MSGTNAFKRGVQDQRLSKRITDARNTRAIETSPEAEVTQKITSNNQQFTQVLPTEAQYATDPIQLSMYPQYRLVQNSTTTTGTTTTTTDCGTTSHPYVACNLNVDVTEFLALLNDVGLRIFRLTDPTNFTDIIYARSLGAREIVPNKADVDSVSSNILILIDELGDFLYSFGKKIAPPGINPYLNNMCPQPKCEDKCDDKCKKGCCSKPPVNISVNSAQNNGVVFPSPPYNPNDIYTFMNCLDTLIEKNTDKDDTIDYNITVFQSIIQNSIVTKFDDSAIDQYQVTRTQPKFSVMTMMLTLLKIDIKFLSILYTLNLHDAFSSPITGAKYGKQRTRINMNGVPVPNNDITNTDIFNASRELKDLLACIFELITFIKIDEFNKIMVDHFGWDANPAPVPAPDDVEITIAASEAMISGITTNDTNIPCFMFGQILSFCDVSRLVVQNNNLPFPSANTDPTITYNALYEPSKVATIAIDNIYGMKAVMQLIENLLKSDAYLSVLNVIFPSGDIHDRDFNPNFEEDRVNEADFLSLLHLSIFGYYNYGKTIAPMSIPNVLGTDSPLITINKIFFCDIYNSQATISNLMWDSGSPFLTMSLCSDQDIYDPNVTFELPTTTTTTGAPTTSTTTSTTTTTISPSSTTSTSTTTAAPTTTTTAAPTTTTTSTTIPPSVFNDMPGIQDLLELKQKCVYTLNNSGSVICPLDKYIKAYADYVRTQYNTVATPYEQPREIRQNRRNIFNMVTNGIKY